MWYNFSWTLFVNSNFWKCGSDFIIFFSKLSKMIGICSQGWRPLHWTLFPWLHPILQKWGNRDDQLSLFQKEQKPGAHRKNVDPKNKPFWNKFFFFFWALKIIAVESAELGKAVQSEQRPQTYNIFRILCFYSFLICVNFSIYYSV